MDGRNDAPPCVPLADGPGNPVEALRRAEFRVDSQNGEDGVLAWLLDRIGVVSREVVEFGIGDGTECCAANLVLSFGWSALLLEADEDDAAAAAARYASSPPTASSSSTRSSSHTT